MKLYTGFGDHGFTALYGGKKVPKTSKIIEVLGDLDELNALLGVCSIAAKERRIKDQLILLQNDLFELGFLVSKGGGLKKDSSSFAKRSRDLEVVIDYYSERLPKLVNFILPNGCSLSSFLHLARAVCRRCERSLLLAKPKLKLDNAVYVYLNRLSDVLFVLARFSNKMQNISDVKWKRS